MSRKFLTPIDLSKLEIQNVALQNLASAPSTPATGQIYYNTGGSIQYYNGSSWQTLGTTAGGATLTIGTGLSGTSYNGSSPVTIAIDSTVVTLTGSQLLTNKSIAGTGLTFNGSTSGTISVVATATAGTNTITLPATTGTVVTTGDTGTVTNTMLAGSIANSKLLNSTISGVSLGSNLNALTISSPLSGTSYNGSSAVSIGLASGYGDTQNPYASKTANYVLAAPNGSSGVPTFRALVAADIPTLGNITNAGAIGSTSGLVVSTTTSGVLTASSALPNGTTATTQSGADNSTKVATTAYVDTYSVLKTGGTMTGALTLSGDPTSALHAATKQYVDNVASGVNAHDAVRTIFTTTIAGTYAAGTLTANPPGDGGTGLGATITFTSTGATTNDTTVTLALNDRVLVTAGVTADSGSSSKANGIYYVSTAGTTGVATVLTRALDYDNSIFGDIAAGDLVYVTSGTSYGGTQWIQTTVGTATSGTLKCVKIGTDSITFTQFSGASSTTAGAGLVANGNAFDVGTASTARIVVNADNIDLATTAVTANSYGSSTAVPTFTVDAYGRLTAASSTAYTDATTSVKGIASFSSSQFTVTSGAVSLTSLAGSVINSGTVSPTYGGTGVNNGTKTITLGGNLTTSGAFNTTLTVTGTTSVTLPTSGTLTAKVTGTNTLGTSFSVNHGLGQWVHAQIFDTSTGAQVECDITNASTSGGTTTFTFAASQTAGAYTYVIIG